MSRRKGKRKNRRKSPKLEGGPQKPSPQEFLVLAGYLSGTANFFASNRWYRGKHRLVIKIQLATKDKEMTNRLYKHFGGSKLRHETIGKLSTKRYYWWALNGEKAADL